MRLDRWLANAGYGSRSEVKTWIRDGRVRVGGAVERDSSRRLTADEAGQIEVDGIVLTIRRHLLVQMNKPACLVTALHDPRLPAVGDLLPCAWLNAGLHPSGRLDRDATGLLLLTTDGQLSHRLTSPRWSIDKTYIVTVEGRPFEDHDVADFAAGLTLADGMRCLPAVLTLTEALQARLTIREGRYHQVKKMMLATGRRVRSLHRLSIGPVVLDPALAEGQMRPLDDTERSLLYACVGMNDSDQS